MKFFFRNGRRKCGNGKNQVRKGQCSCFYMKRRMILGIFRDEMVVAVVVKEQKWDGLCCCDIV